MIEQNIEENKDENELDNFKWVESLNNKPISLIVMDLKPDVSGYLKKEGKINKTWKKRYFIMTGNGIYYFENNDKYTKSLGIIVLKPTSRVITDSKELNQIRNKEAKGLLRILGIGIMDLIYIKENTFGIVGDCYSDKLYKDRLIVVTADSKVNKDKWILKINQTINKISRIESQLEKKDPIRMNYFYNKDIPNIDIKRKKLNALLVLQMNLMLYQMENYIIFI